MRRPSPATTQKNIKKRRSFETPQARALFAGCAAHSILPFNFWGTGAFVDGARMVIDFAFDVIKTHRLEARAAIPAR